MNSKNTLVWQLEKPDEEIRNIIDFTVSQQEKIKALNTLSIKNKDYIENLAKEIDRVNHSTTEINIKKSDRILEKANRPSIKEDKPWFNVEHIRDSLRFRTNINKFESVEEIFDYLKTTNIEFIKIDLVKMFQPRSFGWRCSVFDILLNKQIIEYYHSFKSLFKINDSEAHELFEKWRNCDEKETAEKAKEFREDLEKSTALFDTEWNKELSKLSLTDAEAEQLWNKIAKSIFQKVT